MAGVDEFADNRRTDKSGGAGDEYAHDEFSWIDSRPRCAAR
jgi:hypothetical protein